MIPVSSLAEAAAFFAGHLDIDPTPSRLQELFNTLSHYDDDYADVRGQEMAKRALVIAAAGAHHLLMLGPPGSGNTEYMTRHPTIGPAALPWPDILSVSPQWFAPQNVPKRWLSAWRPKRDSFIERRQPDVMGLNPAA